MTSEGTGDEDQLLLLLEICEEFFARTNIETLDELDRLLAARGITGGPGWLIDMLAFTRTLLQDPADRGH